MRTIKDLTKDEAMRRINSFVVILKHSNLFEIMRQIELLSFIITMKREEGNLRREEERRMLLDLNMEIDLEHSRIIGSIFKNMIQ